MGVACELARRLRRAARVGIPRAGRAGRGRFDGASRGVAVVGSRVGAPAAAGGRARGDQAAGGAPRTLAGAVVEVARGLPFERAVLVARCSAAKSACLRLKSALLAPPK